MLDWVWEWIANWFAMAITEVLDFFTYNLLSMIGTDMTLFGDYFPFAEHAYSIFQYTAWFILALVVMFQLLKAAAGPILESRESPLTLILRAALCAFCIGAAREIFDIFLDIGTVPFEAMLNLDTTIDEFNLGGNAFSTLSDSLVNVLAVAAFASTALGTIILVVMLFLIGFNYLKVLMEAVTRYIVLCVLCYTSPLAYAAGAAKSTQDVFKSWCRMVASQLLLLTLNVWFVRGFNAAIGMFLNNFGATETGDGTFILWFFCVMAYLQVAQRIDSYLAQIGMSAAQTGAGLGMEMLMSLRAISQITGGFATGGGKVSSLFGGGASKPMGTGSTGTGPKMSPFSGETYKRDAATSGSRAGFKGPVGAVARAFGASALAGGAKLSAEAIGTVANGEHGQGSMAGPAADNSLENYIPDMAGHDLSGTNIEPGHISTTATDADGNATTLDMYDAATHQAPDGQYGMTTAEDGSRWYVTAGGANAAGFMSGKSFNGTEDSAAVRKAFPSLPEGTSLRTVSDGVISAVDGDGSSSMLYSAGMYDEPSAPHSTIKDANGMSYYQMAGGGEVPAFSGSSGDAAQFQAFMPGYSVSGNNPVVGVASDSGSGQFEVTHADGSATRFYDSAMYGTPRGEYGTIQDAKGHSWYSMAGTPSVVTRPVYENGQAVMQNGRPVTVKHVETRYSGTPQRIQLPRMKPQQGQGPAPRRK